jgi:ABC-2 type transport system permease protein
MSKITALVRRELWEHRAIVFAPATFGALFVLVNFLAALGIVKIQIEAGDVDLAGVVGSLDALKAGALVQLGLALVAVWLNIVMVLVTSFYLLDCLYAERKDRSILFWKSLPLSDASVVASKLCTAAVAIPLVTLVVFVATGVCMYLITGTAIQFAGSSLVLSAGPLALAETAAFHLYALAVQSLWYLPLFCWLLLVSAWSRRAVLLWALLPPIAVIVAEQIALGSKHFATLLQERLIGVYPLAFADDPARQQLVWRYEDEHADVDLQFSEGLLELVEPGNLLGSPGLWGGIIVAALFFAAAVWTRRYRDDT